MADLRDAILARKRNEAQFAVETISYSGKIVARNGSVSVPGLYDHVWVMPYGEGEPEAVYNRRVRAKAGVWVWVGYTAGSTILEVLGVDVTVSAGNEPTAYLELIKHAFTHRRFGDDPVWLERRMNIDGLHVTPASGLNVRVSPYEYYYQGQRVQFGGLSSLALSLPGAGLQYYALVYLDRATNSLGVEYGSTIAYVPALKPTKPSAPVNSIPAAYVLLYSQTNVSELDITDARLEWGGVEVGGGAWPADGKAMIDTTEYADFPTAAAAAVPGDTIKLGSGEYACDDVSLPRDVTVIGIGFETVLKTTTQAVTLTIEKGCTLWNFRIDNSYQPADSTETIILLVDNSDETSTKVAKLYNMLLSGSRGTGTDSAIIGLKAKSHVDLYDCHLQLSGGEIAKGIFSAGRIIQAYNTYVDMFFSEAGTVESYGLYADKEGTPVPFLTTHGGLIEANSNASSVWISAWAEANTYISFYKTILSSWGGSGTMAGEPITGSSKFVRVNNNVFMTIQAAINFAGTGAGAVVRIGAGTYVEDVVISKAVTLYGDGPLGSVVITNATNTHTVIFTAAATLENLTVNNTSTSNNLAAASVGGATNTTIRNCSLNKSGGATNGYSYYFAGTGHRLIDTAVTAAGATNNFAVRNDTASGAVTITRGKLTGATNSIYSNQSGTTVTLERTILMNSVSNSGATLGEWIDSSYDVHVSSDGPGLLYRATGLRSTAVTSHLNAAPSLSWAAYTNYVTPTTAVTLSQFRANYNGGSSGATKFFGYFGSYSDGFSARCLCGISNNRTGIRMDDGSETNAIMLFLEIQSSGLVKLRYQHNNGSGGSITDLWGSAVMPSMYYWLSMARSGNVVYLYAGVEGAYVALVTAVVFTSWTPTRHGFWGEHPSGGVTDAQYASWWDAYI